MKSLKRIIIAMALIMAFGVSANAQIKFGVKAGVVVNDIKFDKDIYATDNRAGFTGGLMMEVNIPIVGLGVDASVMYVRRSAKITNTEMAIMETTTINNDYIEVPINLKYKFGLPGIGRIVTPYLFTGPSFSFLTSKKAIDDAINNKKFDLSWNFGAGVQILNKVQVGASYGLGLTKASESVTGIDAKNRCWTITAAYLF
ncbi:MAG: porin family protein [Muribaculaceae bacterium]|nr:porin family protein [Muribaculaceae bacterium]